MPTAEDWYAGLQRQADAKAVAAGVDPTLAKVLQQYGYLAGYLGHPEIGPLLREAASKGWSKEILQGRLYQTTWWRTTDAAACELEVLKNTDPAEWTSRVHQKAMELNRIALKAGVKFTNWDAVVEMAVKVLGDPTLNEDSIRTMVFAQAQYDPNKPIGGQFGMSMANLKEQAAEYFVPISDKAAFGWSRRIMSGTDTVEGFQAYLINQAKSRFAHFADDLDRGATTKELFDPYIQQTAQLLDVAPGTINLMEQRWKRMISTKDAETGKTRAMTLSEAEEFVKKSTEYDHTRGAMNEAAQFAENLMQTFGEGESLMAVQAFETSASAYLKEILKQYGLESLTDWARAELAKGYSEVVVLQHLREQPIFRERFKVIFDREVAGLPPMSPAEVVSYEAAADNLMRRSGLPSGFYDSKQDFHDLMLADVSINELTARIENGWNRVSQAPQQVKDAFAEFFGAEGASALAAFFLNPNIAMPLLETQIAAGELGGTARRFGVGMGVEAAMEIARTGVSRDEAEQRFEGLQRQAGLFKENIDEEVDMTVDEEGVAAAFGTDPDARKRLEQRAQQRQAAFAGSGGAQIEQRGASGLGVAGR